MFFAWAANMQGSDPSIVLNGKDGRTSTFLISPVSYFVLVFPKSALLVIVIYDNFCWCRKARDRAKKDTEQEQQQLQQLESQLNDKLATIKTKQDTITKMEADMQEHKQQLGRKELGKLSVQEQQDKVDLQVQLTKLEVC